MIAKVWNRLRRMTFPNYEKVSYAQCGEDLIIDFVFQALKIGKPSYIDIGAYHPQHLSNTFFFYKKGSSGVCVEPDPGQYALIQKARPRDLCVNAGITPDARGEAEFYVMSMNTLNTFSRAEAESIASQGSTRIKKVLRIPTLTFKELLARHHLATPDFISIDVEGEELAILQTMDWNQQRPKVLCVETLTYTENKTERKQEETIAWMKKQGYWVYADTYINSIFVDETAWGNR